MMAGRQVSLPHNQLDLVVDFAQFRYRLLLNLELKVVQVAVVKN